MDGRDLTWACRIVASIERVKPFDVTAVGDLYYDIQDLISYVDQRDLDYMEWLRSHVEMMANANKSELKDVYAEIRKGNNLFRKEKGKSLDANVDGVLDAFIDLVKKMHECILNDKGSVDMEDLHGLSWGERRAAFLDRLGNDCGPFLLLGPTGSGKSFFAYKIWERYSELAHRKLPYVEIDCGKTNDPESVIFGTVRNLSFNGSPDSEGALEQSDGGVLFLDEISRLTKENQNKLLRALNLAHDGKYHFTRMGDTKDRVSRFVLIAATSEPIDNWVKNSADGFLPDLYYRIGGDRPVYIPPIEEQKDIVGEIFRSCLDDVSKYDPLGLGIAKCELKYKKEGLAVCQDYIERGKWPGGVRSLRAFAREVVLGARGSDNIIDKNVVECAIQSFENPQSVPSLPIQNSLGHEAESVSEGMSEGVIHAHKETPTGGPVSRSVSENANVAVDELVIISRLNLRAVKECSLRDRTVAVLHAELCAVPDGQKVIVAKRVCSKLGVKSDSPEQWVDDRLHCFVDSTGKKIGFKAFKKKVLETSV